MNILPKKSWHVRNKDNIARVRRDEQRAAEEEKEVRRRAERAEQEARTDYLRRKSRVALEHTAGPQGEVETSREAGGSEHLNLFSLEDSSEKKGNVEYIREKKEEKEKQERAIGLLVSLGPTPGTEATPWYLKERERDKERQKEREREDKGKRKGISEEEREKKDKKLKDNMDPLKDIKKALAVKDRKEKKHKKRDKVEKMSAGSSKEQLRAERLRREAEERRRAQVLLDQRNGVGGAKDEQKEPEERDRAYNSAYFPELARKRRRKDRDLVQEFLHPNS
ncbi:leukocyte receptor cluster member 1 [Tachysurus ichikawai]